MFRQRRNLSTSKLCSNLSHGSNRDVAQYETPVRGILGFLVEPMTGMSGHQWLLMYPVAGTLNTLFLSGIWREF